MTDTQPASTPAADEALSEHPALHTARRIWAAAYRDAADHANAHSVPAIRSFAHFLADRADAIGRGDFTPWANVPEPSTPPAQHPPLDDQLCDDPDCGCCYPGGLEEAQPTGEEVIRYAALVAGMIPAGPRAVTQAVLHGLLQDGWERPAGPDPHPDTPGGAQDGTGVLGRAWLDRHGGLWQGDDLLRSGGIVVTRGYVEKYGGPVREVLLVSPAAGPVLDAACRFRAAKTAAASADPESAGSVDLANDVLNDAEDDLVDAVDAYDRPTTGADVNSTPNNIQTETNAAPAVGCLLTADNDMQAFAELPDCTACEGTGKDLPPDWRSKPAGTTLAVPDSPKTLRETLCVAQTGIASAVPVLSRRQHLDRLQRLIDECDRHRPLGPDGKHGGRHTPTCGCDPTPAPEQGSPFRVIHDRPGDFAALMGVVRTAQDRHAEPAPEPAGDGPGWERESIIELIRMLRNAGLTTQQYHADQVEALLADRDRLEERDQAAAYHPHSGQQQVRELVGERDAALAELAEVTAQRDEARNVAHVTATAYGEVERERDQDRAEADKLRAELAEVCQRWRRLALTVYPAAHPGWGGSCLCEDKEAHDLDCRQGHGPECGADCDGPCILPVERQRAELVEVTADRDRLHAVAERAMAERREATGKVLEEHLAYQHALDERDAARAELAEMERLRQRLEHLTTHTKERADEHRAELATARRDGAADALDEAIRIAHGLVGGAEVEEVLRFVAAEVRAGTRTVGGSPEPAGGEESEHG